MSHARPLTGSFFAVAALTLATIPALAMDQSAEQIESSKPCSAAEYRQFDFWVGEWEVTNPNGDVVGTNRIDRILGGCALQENWVGKKGSIGHSFNIYDRTTGKWHQTWVDNGGLLLQLEGGIEDGTMVFQGKTLSGDDRTTLHRLAWKPGSDGTVRQHWESSKDDGKTWKTVFDGTYAKKTPTR